MLVLSRHPNEEIILELPDGRLIRLLVIRINLRDKTARIGIDAPVDVRIDRAEIRERRINGE